MEVHLVDDLYLRERKDVDACLINVTRNLLKGKRPVTFNAKSQHSQYHGLFGFPLIASNCKVS